MAAAVVTEVVVAESARLSNRSVLARVGGTGVVPVDANSPQPAALTRTRPAPAPPAPVPPLAPPMRSQQMVPAESALVSASAAAASTPVTSPPALPAGRVASLLATAVLTLVVVAGLGWLGQGEDPGLPTQTTVIRVGAGETVWDVARRVAPQSDQRAVVNRIRELNGLVGSAVVAGQRLEVPDGR
jgi:LysM domain